jgi:hypothetical protein
MCNTKYGQVNKFQESFISSDAYRHKTSTHISFLTQQMDFYSKPTKCSFTEAHNVAILDAKACCIPMQTDGRYKHGEQSKSSVKKVRRLLPFIRLFTNGYAYRNSWPRSIISQICDPFLGQFGKLKASPCLSARPHGKILFPLDDLR